MSTILKKRKSGLRPDVHNLSNDLGEIRAQGRLAITTQRHLFQTH
jgi:hypothetical protein